MKDTSEVKSLFISLSNELISGSMDGSVKYWEYEINYAPYIKIKNHSKVVN
jgi:WD40 repeat protein